MKRSQHDRLPSELLPEPSLEVDPVVWEERVQNLMVAARPTLARYRTGGVPWWIALAEQLRPRLAVALAAAAGIMLVVHATVPMPSARADESLPLATVIGGGQPAAALWAAAQGDVDPVLAVVILEGEGP